MTLNINVPRLVRMVQMKFEESKQFINAKIRDGEKINKAGPTHRL